VKREAEGKLRAFFETSLDEVSHAEEPIGFDEVAAYVDGRMHDIDREIFESRLADDPALQAEVADLTAMRDAMPAPRAVSGVMTTSTAAAGATATATATERRRTMRTTSMLWILGGLAAAACLTGVVIWFAAPARPGSPTSTDLPVAQHGAPDPHPSTTPSTAPRVALHDNGGDVALDAAGRVILPTGAAISDALQQDAVAALSAGTLPQTTMPRELRSSGPLTLMGHSQSEARFGIVAPVATLVRDARPAFRWQAHPRARAYIVVIFTDRLERVTSSGELRGTTWTPDVDLKPGTTYEWQVTASTPTGPEHAPAPPLPEARFRVLSAEQRRVLDRQLAEAGSSNLLRGLALIRAGVLDEAESAFAALVAANPTSAPARDLLTGVRRLRGAPAPTAR
jgi:hypothetical protein